MFNEIQFLGLQTKIQSKQICFKIINSDFSFSKFIFQKQDLKNDSLFFTSYILHHLIDDAQTVIYNVITKEDFKNSFKL